MALTDKGGFDLGSRLKKDAPPSLDELTPTPTPTSTLAPTLAYTPAYTVGNRKKERKTERLQLTVRPSTKARLAKYAEDHGTSSNEVVQSLLEAHLDDAGY